MNAYIQRLYIMYRYTRSRLHIYLDILLQYIIFITFVPRFLIVSKIFSNMKCSFCEENIGGSSVICEACTESVHLHSQRKDIALRKKRLSKLYEKYTLLLKARKFDEINAKKLAMFNIKEEINIKNNTITELQRKIKCQKIRNEECKMALSCKENDLNNAKAKVLNAKISMESIFTAIESDIKNELVRSGDNVAYRVWSRIIELFTHFPIDVDSKLRSFIIEKHRKSFATAVTRTTATHETHTQDDDIYENIDMIDSNSISTILGFPFPNSSRYFNQHIKQQNNNNNKKKEIVNLIPNSVLRVAILIISQVTVYLSKLLSIRLPHAVLINMQNSLVFISESNPLDDTQEMSVFFNLGPDTEHQFSNPSQDRGHLLHRSDRESDVHEKQQRLQSKNTKEWIGGDTEESTPGQETVNLTSSSKGKTSNTQSQVHSNEDTHEIDNNDLEEINLRSNHQLTPSEWYMLIPPSRNEEEAHSLNSGMPYMFDGRVRAYNYSEVTKILSGYRNEIIAEEDENDLAEDFSDMNSSVSLSHFQVALEYLQNNVIYLCLKAGVDDKTLLPSESILLNLFSLQQHALRIIHRIRYQPERGLMSLVAGKDRQKTHKDANLNTNNMQISNPSDSYNYSNDYNFTSPYQLHQLLYPNQSDDPICDGPRVNNHIYDDDDEDCLEVKNNNDEKKELDIEEENQDDSDENDSVDLSELVDSQMRHVTMQMKSSLDENMIKTELNTRRLSGQNSGKREGVSYYEFHLNQKAKNSFYKDNTDNKYLRNSVKPVGQSISTTKSDFESKSKKDSRALDFENLSSFDRSSEESQSHDGESSFHPFFDESQNEGYLQSTLRNSIFFVNKSVTTLSRSKIFSRAPEGPYNTNNSSRGSNNSNKNKNNSNDSWEVLEKECI